MHGMQDTSRYVDRTEPVGAMELSPSEWPPIPVFFSTTHGQTRRIAEHLAQHLRERGHGSLAIDLDEEGESTRSWAQVEGAIVCASVHVSGHQRAATRFATTHRAELARVPSLFVSVCLAIQSKNAADRDAARNIADTFGEKTGWHPDEVVCVAGRLAYTSYNWWTRFVMKRIAAAEGASTDTTKDHEYTDWEQVERVAAGLCRRIVHSQSRLLPSL